MAVKYDIEFRSWLINNQYLQRRSAGDLVSRRKKLKNLVANHDSLSMSEIEMILQVHAANGEFTRSTLRSMLRAETLFREFSNKV